MPYTIKSQQIAVKDPDTGEYVNVDILAEQTKEGLLSEINILANNKKNEITQLGDSKKQAIADEATSQASAITQLVDLKKQAIADEATLKKTEITQLADSKKQAIADEATSQASAITQLVDSKKQAIADEAASQIRAVETKGQEVLASIPSDYTELVNTVNSMADSSFIYDTKTGTTASFDAGADNMLIKSLVVDIKPTQELNGHEPSYENFCPITGWTGATVSHSGADTSDPETISVNWQSEAGTVYGGSIDIVSGEMFVTLMGKHFSDLTWTKNANLTYGFNGAGFSNRKKRIISYDNPDCYCDTYPWYNANNPNGLTNDVSFGIALSNSNNNIYTYVVDNRFSTVNDFIASFTTHDPFFVCPLENPILVQLTPQEVSCLVGVNNIWADTGDVTVTYPVDTKTYIDKKIQEAIDGLSGS